METNKNFLVAFIILLVIGVAGGFYIGKNIGLKEGRQEIIDQQKAEEEAKLKEIQEKANPFSEIEDVANPFKDTYQNPFAE